MTKSLPGVADLRLGANHPRMWTRRVQGTVVNVGVKVLPWIPTPAKRILSAGRSVIIDGNTLDPTLQLMLSTSRIFGVDGLAVDDDIVASRAHMRAICEAMPGPQIHVDVTDLSIPGPAGEIPARHYRPSGGGATPLLVFYHGGGWTLGDLDTHDALCRLTCRDADIQVLSIDYRLAPEHPAPAAVEDAYAAFVWAHEHASDEFGALPGRVAVGGDSAGGNLSAVVCQLARDKARYEGGHPGTAVAAVSQDRFHRTDSLNGPVRQWLPADQAGHRLVPHAIPQGFRCRSGGSAVVAVVGRIAVRAGACSHRGRRLRPIARRRRKLCEGAAGCRDCSGLAVSGFADAWLPQPVSAGGRQCCRDQRADLRAARAP